MQTVLRQLLKYFLQFEAAEKWPVWDKYLCFINHAVEQRPCTFYYINIKVFKAFLNCTCVSPPYLFFQFWPLREPDGSGLQPLVSTGGGSITYFTHFPKPPVPREQELLPSSRSNFKVPDWLEETWWNCQLGRFWQHSQVRWEYNIFIKHCASCSAAGCHWIIIHCRMCPSVGGVYVEDSGGRNHLAFVMFSADTLLNLVNTATTWRSCFFVSVCGGLKGFLCLDQNV